MTTNINEYLRDINKASKLIINASEKVIKNTAKKLKERIEYYTPVGDPKLWNYPAASNYTPGTLKASWELEEGREYAIISNGQPYALRVETGWSTQAPNGMMRRAVMDFPELLDETAKENKL